MVWLGLVCILIFWIRWEHDERDKIFFGFGLWLGWVGLGLVICFLDSGRRNGSFCWKLRCASNVIFSCSLVNLTVLREICAPQTHPIRFVKSTHPTRGVRVRRTHPSRIPEDILLDRVQGTKYETGKLVQPGFLIREWMRSTLILYNDSWISSFPVSLRPPFSLLIFSIVVSILLFC